MTDAQKRVCAVVGVGPGNGAAFARRFAAEGYAVAMLARGTELTRALARDLPGSRAFACDVSVESSVATAFSGIRGELGEVDTLVYNAGSGSWGTIEDATPAAFEAVWRVNALGAFLVSKEVIPAMKKAGRGNIVFIGANRVSPTRFSSSRTTWRTRSFA